MARRIRRKLSDATKYKMSLSKRGKSNPMAGKHHTEETKRLISKRLKEYWRNVPLE